MSWGFPGFVFSVIGAKNEGRKQPPPCPRWDGVTVCDWEAMEEEGPKGATLPLLRFGQAGLSIYACIRPNTDRQRDFPGS